MPERPSAALALLVIAAVIAAVIAVLLGCASGPQGQASTTPQACTITIDASDGGTAYIGGDVWLDARGTAGAEQHGLEATSDVDSQIDSTVTVTP